MPSSIPVYFACLHILSLFLNGANNSLTMIMINLWIWTFYYRIMETAPTLPDFALALKPDEFILPPVDSSWNEEHINRGQIGLSQLRNDKR